MPFKRGYIPWNKGKHHSLKIRKKISRANKGKKKPPFSRLHKKRLSLGMLNKHNSVKTEFQKGGHASRKTEFKKGGTSPNKGKKLSLLWRKHIGRARLMSIYGKGANHWNWKGGISKGYKEQFGSRKYKLWRMKVFLRDNFKCQFCGLRTHVGLNKTVYLEAHHIKSWNDYPALRFDINNGITLCKDCHNLTKGRPSKSSKEKKGLI